MQQGALLALASALSFGLCDFVAGLASRRLSFWWVTVLSLVASALGAWVVVVAQADTPSTGSVLWGLAAGIGAGSGASALYRGYGRGQMAVAGPLSAVGAAALPAVVGAALGDRLPLPALVGVVIALPAIWLMSRSRDRTSKVRAGVTDGLVSGCGFALEFVALERAGDAAGLSPVAVSQTTALVLVAVVVSAKRPSWRSDWTAPALGVAAGLMSLAATAFYFLASQTGMLMVAAVLASLYPGATVALAAVFLHERPDRTQTAGLLLGGVAVTLIVLG